MANTTLPTLLALIADNLTGDISGADLQIITTELWNNAIITTATDGNFAVFGTDVHTNDGTIVDSNLSPLTLPLSTIAIAALDTKLEYPLVAGTSGDLLMYNGTAFDWETPDKDTVGLSNVDDTSDLSKPISTLTQAEIDTKQDTLPTDAAGYLLNDGGGVLSWAAVPVSGATQLDELSDVTINTTATLHALIHDGTDFKNRLLIKTDISDFSDLDYASSSQGDTADSATQISATDSTAANVRTLVLGEPTDVDVNISTSGSGADLIMSADVRALDDLRFVVPHVTDAATLGAASDVINKGVLFIDKSDDILKFSDGTDWIKIEKTNTVNDIELSICSVRATTHTIIQGESVEFTVNINNPHAAWNVATSTYTVPSTGNYNISTVVDSDVGNTVLGIYENGTIVPQTAILADPNYSNAFTTILPFTAGDVLSIRNLNAVSLDVADSSYITIYKIS